MNISILNSFLDTISCFNNSISKGTRTKYKISTISKSLIDTDEKLYNSSAALVFNKSYDECMDKFFLVKINNGGAFISNYINHWSFSRVLNGTDFSPVKLSELKNSFDINKYSGGETELSQRFISLLNYYIGDRLKSIYYINNVDEEDIISPIILRDDIIFDLEDEILFLTFSLSSI